MSLLRTSSAALLALFIGHADASRAYADTAASLSTARARGGILKKVYDPKAAPISAGALLQGGGYGHVTQAQYDTLKYVTKEVMKKFPANTSYYFGLGRSPACIISMIQNLAADPTKPEKLAMNFPASGMHDGGAHDDASYFRHFDALIPAEVIKGDKTIVLLDRSRPFSGGAASGGESLYIFKQILQRYLVSKGSSVKVEAVGFSYGQLNPSYGLHHIPFDLNTQGELETVSMAHYEAIAEYPHHRIAPSLKPPGRRNEYVAYKKAMLERMRRDPELDAFLDQHARAALQEESAQEKAARAAEQAREAAAQRAEERGERAKDLLLARSFPKQMRKTIDELVANMPLRPEGHDSGPYLSENGKALNDWLQQSVAHRAEIEGVVPSVKRAGPNLVASVFMDKVEQARDEKKLRNRDYRRLMGHALSAAVMDAEMLKSLVSRFETSEYFRREITEEADYYLGSHAKKARPETANMAAGYQALLKQLPASVQAQAAK